MRLNSRQKKLRRRIIEVSYKNRFSWLGSCLTAIDIIDEIYKKKNPEEKFVLSNGHAAVAWYVVLEDLGLLKNIEKLNSHPDRKGPITCSSGSLGYGLPIALGIALANRKKNVYCLITDGELAEGSIWESLMIAEKYKVRNLKIYLNFNGWSAYDSVKAKDAQIRLLQYLNLDITLVKTKVEQLPFLKGLDAHYHIMTDKDYKLAMKLLK